MGPWPPFRLIILGALLTFVSSITAGAVNLVFLYGMASGSPNPTPAWIVVGFESLLFFAGPLGSFLVIYGIASGLRAPRASPAPPLSVPNPGAAPLGMLTPAIPIPRRSPFRVTVVGALVALAASLGEGVFIVMRYLLPPVPTPGPGYFLMEASVGIVTAMVAGAGSFVAFVGIALALRRSVLV